MTTITHWINPGLAEALGWTLLHSLWQGAAIALLLAVALILMRKQSATLRYWVASLSLMGLLVCSLITFEWIYEPAPPLSTAATELATSTLLTQETAPLGQPTIAKVREANHPTVYLSYFEQHLPLLVTVWLIGVFLLSLRLLGEIAYIQHLKHYRCRVVGGEWQEKLDRMAHQLGIRRAVLLKETFRIHSPMVIGVFKQVILLPPGLLTGLSPRQVEAILAHELAHVRRYDYLVNIFISMVEILFFFNPMMWWISRRVKAEREHACDDLAVEWTGDTLSFVKTLAQLEEWRFTGRSLAMGLTGSTGSVLSRIQRMLRQEDRRLAPLKALGVLLGISLCFALLAFQGQALTKSAPTEPSATQDTILPSEPAGTPQTGEAEWPNAALADIPEEEHAATASLELASLPEEESLEPAHPEPMLSPLPKDTIPQDEAAVSKALNELEEKMAAMRIAWARQEQALRREELELERERQKAMNEKRKVLMELEISARNLENETEMKERSFEMENSGLQLEELKMEEMEQRLQLLREELNALGDSQEASEAYQKKLQEYQQAQKALLEQQAALQKKAFMSQQAQQSQLFEIQKVIQELNNQHFVREQEMQAMEQDFRLRMMELHHKAQALQAEQKIKEKELEILHRRLMMQIEE